MFMRRRCESEGAVRRCRAAHGAFFYSAKAFDVLERMDPNPEFWEARHRPA